MLTQVVMPIVATSMMARKFPLFSFWAILKFGWWILWFYIHRNRHVITTGRDGDIRIWNGVDDDDPNTQCVGEFVLYHVFYDNRILASTDMNTVQAYTYPDGDRDGTEFRFTAPVTCIKVNDKVCKNEFKIQLEFNFRFHKYLQFIAACSEDMTIKVMPRDKSMECFDFAEHEGPVLRIDLSRNGLLASSSGDGTIKIWNLDGRKVVKTLTGFDKVKSYEGNEVFGKLIQSKCASNT